MSPVRWITLANTISVTSFFLSINCKSWIPLSLGSLSIWNSESVYLIKYFAVVIHLWLSREEQFLKKGKLRPLWSGHPVFILFKIRFWLNAIFKSHPVSGNTRFFHYQTTLQKSYHSNTSVILHFFLKIILLTFPQLMSSPLQKLLVHTHDIIMEYNDIKSNIPSSFIWYISSEWSFISIS